LCKVKNLDVQETGSRGNLSIPEVRRVQTEVGFMILSPFASCRGHYAQWNKSYFPEMSRDTVPSCHVLLIFFKCIPVEVL
jgi:hypothetical protein